MALLTEIPDHLEPLLYRDQIDATGILGAKGPERLYLWARWRRYGLYTALTGLAWRMKWPAAEGGKAPFHHVWFTRADEPDVNAQIDAFARNLANKSEPCAMVLYCVEANFEAIEMSLKQLPETLRPHRLVVGSYLPPTLTRDDTRAVDPDAWSQLWMRFEVLHLDPWRAGWEQRIHALFEREAGGTAVETRSETIVSPVAPDVCQRWSDLAIRRTGGLPPLLGPLLTEFRRLASRDDLDPNEEILVRPEANEMGLFHRRVEIYVRYLLSLQSGVLDRALKEAGRHIGLLQAIARNDPVTVPLRQRQSLLATGLVRYDPFRDSWEIPGEFLKEYLLESTDEPSPVPEPPSGPTTLEMVEQAQGESGFLRVILPNAQVVQVPVTQPVHWRILTCLARNTDRYLSTGDIQKAIGHETTNATYSAMSRLRTLLEERGLPDLVRSVHGKGYRLQAVPKGTSGDPA